MSKGWDSIALKKLKSLTGKGLSTSEIGKRLGMSKNAIVGKLNRLGWNAKAGGAPTEDTDKKTKKSTTKTETKKTPVEKKATTPKKANSSKATKSVKTAKTPVKTTDKKATSKPASKTVTATPATAKPAGTSAKNLAMHQRIIQHSLEMANLKPNQCRWPIGDPDSEHFHFCGETVFVGKPYCYEHCKQAYQFAPPKKK